MIPKPQKHKSKSKRAKAVDIPQSVKQAVWERDKGTCVYCGDTQNCLPNAHYIRRSHGGLGIERNIVTLCVYCHHEFDNGKSERLTEDIRKSIEIHLKSHYPNWNKEDLIYRKEY